MNDQRTYRENQQIAIDAHINALALVVANEVDFALECVNNEALDENRDDEVVELNPNEFEAICFAVEEAYLKYADVDVTVELCAQTAVALLVEGWEIDNIDRYSIGDHLW